MSRSYIPEYAYGAIHDDNGRWTGKYGLVPWPAHLRPQETPDIELTKKGEAYVAAALAEADGVFFLTLDRNDRTSVATTIERLIDMLDAVDGDENLEPSLGAPENHPGGYKHSDADGWKAKNADDREEACEDEGAQCEDEGVVTGDNEPALGTTEEIDQVRRLESAAGWMCEDGEPSLGWAESHGRGIVGSQNCLDDREHEDECEPEYDGGVEDFGFDAENDSHIRGGGSVSQYEDGWRPAPDEATAPAMVEKARRLKNGDVVREISASAPPDAIPMLRASDFDKLPFA
ncbi:MAG: hypothetical protein BGN87_18575 [Rhizobiales bacterium 65-79]|jgi:hypothetical protein|nr:hypothetical protein [Hyphomicrobiales bacterium]OJU03609.1 MAG: hypothetical protein BGN87_18575 [Rhizobiales bacterium 65-79]